MFAREIIVTQSASTAGHRISPQPACVFVPAAVEIRPARVLRIMGYREGGPVRPAVERVAAAMAELAAAAMTPVVHYRRLGLERLTSEGLSLAGGISFQSAAFAKYLADCREVIAFVLTLGGRFDTVENNLVKKGGTLEAVLLEAAGWVAVEEITRQFTERLAHDVNEEGLACSRRLAPGYTFRIGSRKVGWPLEQQKLFFTLFDGTRLPVELLDSCAMTPKMSRTGLFGLRPATAATPSSNC